MASVVTEACCGAKHLNCVDVCPVNAFRDGDDMVYIDPDVCIACGACISACPSKAIYSEASVPEDLKSYIKLNAVESKKHPVITESQPINVVALSAAEQSKLRFAVVGAGASGFFSAEALLKQHPGARIDIIERLPVPFGLVRYGIAPDHQQMKQVANGFASFVQQNPTVNFIGNVEIGKQISRDELLKSYDYVIYSTGASNSRVLDIPGYDLKNVFGASDVVGWYNGHPDHQASTPDFSAKQVAILGMGNVAFDVARVLCQPTERLSQSDVSAQVLTALEQSGIREVSLLELKGPFHAGFTPNQLQQLIDIPELNLEVDPKALELDPSLEQVLALPENSMAKERIDLLRSLAGRQSNGDKTIRFVFNATSQTFTGSRGKVTGITGIKNQVSLNADGQPAIEPTEESFTLPAQMVINAAGFYGTAIDGLQFDSKRGAIGNHEGRALLADGSLSEKEYVAGWIKRGPIGVVGTNKRCASDTVKALTQRINDPEQQPATAPSQEIRQLLEQSDANWFDFDDWLALDGIERRRGAADNRPRAKIVQLDEMLKLKPTRKVIKQAKINAPMPVTAASRPVDKSQPVKTHYRNCTICESMCAVKIDTQGEHIISVTGDDKNSFSNGHICPKGASIAELHNDPERLRTPLKRVGDTWEPIDWDEAYDEVTRRLVDIQREHGDDAVATFFGNPGCHNVSVMTFYPLLQDVLNTKNFTTAGSIDMNPHMISGYLMYGHQYAMAVPDIDRTDYMLMLGANPAASKGSQMTAGDAIASLEKVKQRGGKWVLVDPRRTESADHASEHLFIKPGSDALFLLGLIQVVVNHDKVTLNPRLPILGDIDEIKRLANSIPLDTIAERTQIAIADIERIALEFAAADKAVCYGRMGISVQDFAGLNHWLVQVLNIITDNLDQPGGFMFPYPAASAIFDHKMSKGSFGTFTSRVHGLPEFVGCVPATTLADEMLTPGEGQVKAFICYAGNPTVSVPNGKKLAKALDHLEFMVSVDFYLNETSRHADIILPPTGPLEHSNYDLVFSMLSVRNSARYSEAVFQPDSNAQSDRDILLSIIKGITHYKASYNPLAQLKAKAGGLLLDVVTEDRLIDTMLRFGPFGSGLKSYLNLSSDTGLTLDKVKQLKHGKDLGPLQSIFPERLFTEDKKIHLLPEEMLDEMKRLQASVGHAEPRQSHPDAEVERLEQMQESACQLPGEQSDDYPLLLIGRRDLRSNNSWFHNFKSLVKGKNRCTLLVHPQTAAGYGVVDGDTVYLRSAVGEVKAPVEISDKIMPGVVSLPHGWGHDKDGMLTSVASAHAGVSCNDVTSDSHYDKLTGNASFNGVPVIIEKYAGAPEIVCVEGQ